MVDPISSAASLAGRDEAALAKGAKNLSLASQTMGSLALRYVEGLTWDVSGTLYEEVTHGWQAPLCCPPGVSRDLLAT